jgi:hypothetical protein
MIPTLLLDLFNSVNQAQDDMISLYGKKLDTAIVYGIVTSLELDHMKSKVSLDDFTGQVTANLRRKNDTPIFLQNQSI